MSQPMNREQRRLLKKQGQEVDDDGQVVATRTKAKSAGAGGSGSGSGSGSRVTTSDDGDKGGSKRQRNVATPEERTSPTQFVREVRTELRKVSWPTRAEVLNYSTVVFFTVIVLTAFIGLLDWLFSVSVLTLFQT